MSRLVHVFREVGRSFIRNFKTVIGSFLSLMLTFLLFDLFWISAGTSDLFYKNLLSQLQMEVFLAESVSEPDFEMIKMQINKIEGVDSVHYISKEEAREELRKLVGSDLLGDYEKENPLPRSFVLNFTPDILSTENMKAIEQKLNEFKGVSQVFYSRTWLEKAEKTRRIITDIGMILGVIVLLTALINSTNNIRLMVRTRAVGIQQMRLLGAGKVFIAMPFIIEGMIISIISALAGWLLIWYFQGEIIFTRFELVFPHLEEILWYCGAAGFLGALSGYLGIRRFLKR